MVKFLLRIVLGEVEDIVKAESASNEIVSLLVSLFGAIASALLKHHTSPQVQAVSKDVQGVVAAIQSPGTPTVGGAGDDKTPTEGMGG